MSYQNYNEEGKVSSQSCYKPHISLRRKESHLRDESLHESDVFVECAPIHPSDNDVYQGYERDTDYSKPFDQHRWSDHMEVNLFVDHIYNDHFGDFRSKKTRQLVKNVLLDLYVTWYFDSFRVIAIRRDSKAYRVKSNYNEMNISRDLVHVVDRLMAVGLLSGKGGSYNKVTRSGKCSRVWPTQSLISMFEQACFTVFDVGSHVDRETIILKSRKQKAKGDDPFKPAVEINYEDTEQTVMLREPMIRYNAVLQNNIIDIASEPSFIVETGRATREEREVPVNLIIDQQRKFVWRVFTSSDPSVDKPPFDLHGRFYGGWWQNCPQKLRPYVTINGNSTVEIDFSAIHIVLLYARVGISYANEIGGDPYRVPHEVDFGFGVEELRSITKSVVLMGLNADRDKDAFSAFRDKHQGNGRWSSLKNVELETILGAFQKQHPLIEDRLCDDAGIELMHDDSRIAALVIDHFTRKGIVVLCIHDSFIVETPYADELKRVMQASFKTVMGFDGPDVKIATPVERRLESIRHRKLMAAFDRHRSELKKVDQGGDGLMERGRIGG